MYTKKRWYLFLVVLFSVSTTQAVHIIESIKKHPVVTAGVVAACVGSYYTLKYVLHRVVYRLETNIANSIYSRRLQAQVISEQALNIPTVEEEALVLEKNELQNEVQNEEKKQVDENPLN